MDLTCLANIEWLQQAITWLVEVDWTREAIGTTAIVTGMVGKWKLGSGKKIGWIWSFVGTLFWFLFALRIESPTGIFNNFVYLYLSVRGYRIWEKSRIGVTSAPDKEKTTS